MLANLDHIPQAVLQKKEEWKHPRFICKRWPLPNGGFWSQQRGSEKFQQFTNEKQKKILQDEDTGLLWNSLKRISVQYIQLWEAQQQSSPLCQEEVPEFPWQKSNCRPQLPQQIQGFLVHVNGWGYTCKGITSFSIFMIAIISVFCARLGQNCWAPGLFPFGDILICGKNLTKKILPAIPRKWCFC